MRISKKTISILSATLLLSIDVYGGGFVKPFGGGINTLGFKSNYLIGERADSRSGFEIQIAGGYQTTSNVNFELSHSVTSTDFLFGYTDQYKIAENTFSIGYSYEVSQHFRWIPKIGISSWSLDVEDGGYFGDGDRVIDPDAHYSGTGLIAAIGFEFPVGDFVPYTAVILGSYQFGTTASVTGGIGWQF